MRKKASILIVDDEESIRVSLKTLFKKENYKTEVAKNASIALEKIETMHFDLILTDIMMEKKTGIDLLKNVKQNHPNIVVLLMTGYASMESAMKSVQLGAMDYLVKPISKETLLFNVRRCLEINELQKNSIIKNDTTNDFLKTIKEKNIFTQKETIVYKHLISGLPNKNIGEKLNITLPTVKFHLKNIYKKLGIKGRSGVLKLISQNTKI